ncbi:MAG: CPXCG motif-containing cysteine-rich protein, partial [Steroidobacteraceae bacterium]
MPDRKENPPSVDEVYGLEPVIEPGDGNAAGGPGESVQWRTVECPYCGEPFDTAVDLSCGSASYIEDCQVCCRPIEVRLEVTEDGSLASLQAGRSD